jgi:hypothetical protein
MKNEILLEVWRNRDEFARRCNYNLDIMIKKLQQIERNPRNPLASRTRKTPAGRPSRPPRSRRS